jgi:Zinc carboxypeptidase
MRRTLALAFLLALAPIAWGAVPTPESVLGFRLGEDRTLADWSQALRYFKALAAASERVSVADVGKTTEGRPFLIVTISSEANMRRLEEIRTGNLRLWDPRGLADAEAERLIHAGRTIVALNHGIHSSEVAASQTAMETAYALATGDDPLTREILDATVIVMIPSHNPDGMQRVTEWYRSTLGTPYEGAEEPFLYHHYAGHDNNRDWYMFTQAETRLTVKHLFDRWRPQLVHDLHQMGSKGARIFVPPYVDPIEPNVDPALRSALTTVGTSMAASLAADGRSGVVFHAIYDAWSPSRAYPHTHGGLRVLSEVASARYASPIDVPFEELRPGIGYDARKASWNFPDPWPGGHWRLRDIMDYQRAATQALLLHAARNREFWLRNFLAVNRRASQRREPFAFVVPAGQRDPLATARLLDVLATGAVEIRRAASSFRAEGRVFPAGSHVVLMAQPASAFAKTLLEAQRYPEIRPCPGGPAQEPYDVTAHTLPYLLGVDVVSVRQPLETPLDQVTILRVEPGRVLGGGGLFALGHGTGELVALGRLLRAGIVVRWSTSGFQDGGRRFAPGTLLVPASARSRLETLARELGFIAQGVGARSGGLVLRTPKVGVYQSFAPAMDEGWTRYVLDRDLGIAYETLHDADVRRGGLRARFDAIVLPDQTPRAIVFGRALGSLPEAFTGGLGDAGVAALEAFVHAGGTLVALNEAAMLPVADFPLGVTATLAGEVKTPGSILRTQVLQGRPLAHGLAESAAVWFSDSPVLDAPADQVVLSYAEPNPLLSGYLEAPGKLRGHAALVEAPLGRGSVVLFGFRPQYRAQSWATYVPFANALYLAAARE